MYFVLLASLPVLRLAALCVVQKSRSAFESCPRFQTYQTMKAALLLRIQHEQSGVLRENRGGELDTFERSKVEATHERAHQTAVLSEAAAHALEPVGDGSQSMPLIAAMPSGAAAQCQTAHAPCEADGATMVVVRPYHSLSACAVSAMMLCRAASVVTPCFPAGVGPAFYNGFVMCEGTGVQIDGAAPQTIGTLLIAAAGGISRVSAAGMSVGERGDITRLSAGIATGSSNDLPRPPASADPPSGGVAAPRDPVQYASSSLAYPSDPSVLPTLRGCPGDAAASRLSAAEPTDADAAAGAS